MCEGGGYNLYNCWLGAERGFFITFGRFRPNRSDLVGGVGIVRVVWGEGGVSFCAYTCSYSPFPPCPLSQSTYT